MKILIVFVVADGGRNFLVLEHSCREMSVTALSEQFFDISQAHSETIYLICTRKVSTISDMV